MNFIIENAVNTCYIDSLLMALFFEITHLDELLSKNLKNTNVLTIYLQEYIKEKFVNVVRNEKSVLSDDIDMIRTLCFQLGWRNTSQDEYINQQDVNEFFVFLMEIFENEQITMSRYSVSENVYNESFDVGQEETIPFIPLSLPENQTMITVKELLHNWLYDNISDLKSINIEENNTIIIKGLNTYFINNSPQLLCLSINRFNNQGTRIMTNVIIQKKISPYNKEPLNVNKWEFQSAICHRGLTNKSGHYYTLLSKNDKWYIFDDLEVPCMREVYMDDITVTNMLKKECVFLIYRLPKFY